MMTKTSHEIVAPSPLPVTATGDDGPPDASQGPKKAANLALTAADRLMLAWERRPWRDPVVKAQAIHQRFGWSPTRYYQRLNRLIDQPAAWAADPMTVKRLRRRRQVGIGGC
ncbi:MAG: DUF3263 domain-containing protein [Propionibacteriaceae bacterium]|jgi:hypothetical protein|nr:DUF3263 domain-containing protein [Propionibacteriaceae bacterium]